VNHLSSAWRPINTLNQSDELVWVRKGDSIDGPKVVEPDDYDRYAEWAPCEPPPRRRSALPKDPPLGLIMSMAIRYDHGLGVPGYYDGELMRAISGGLTHKQRLLAAMATMRQLYEEVSGHGFYLPELEASYAARAGEELQDVNDERELTHEDLQHAIQGAAAKLIEMATSHGVVLTIDHRRTPDSRPSQYVIETRPTRAVYSKKPETTTQPTEAA
jgi:hypothetical protein